jgi:hypothetical protein
MNNAKSDQPSALPSSNDREEPEGITESQSKSPLPGLLVPERIARRVAEPVQPHREFTTNTGDGCMSGIYPSDDGSGSSPIPNWWNQLSDPCLQYIIEQGKFAADFLFADDWCLRRTARFRFMDERRGEWSAGMYFSLPERFHRVALLNHPHPSIPVTMVRKYIFPIGYDQAHDDRGHDLFIQSSYVAHCLSFSILLARLAEIEAALKDTIARSRLLNEVTVKGLFRNDWGSVATLR